MKGHGAKIQPQDGGSGSGSADTGQRRCAARSAGISVATLLRWQKEPEFQRATREARRAAFGQAITRLQMSGAAVATLAKMMVEQGAPPSTRVRAAEVILHQAAKAIEWEDVEARVTELERAAEAANKPR